jgi:hypothetical protein
MNCEECGKPIPKRRLKALPDTKTCVKCSQVQRVVGFTSWDKTTSDLVILNKDEADLCFHLARQRMDISHL